MKTLLCPTLEFPGHPKIASAGQRTALAVLLSLLVLLSPAAGQDGAVLDFPLTSTDGAVPVGLAAWPRETEDGLLAIEIPFLPIDSDGSVLVTLVFQDDETRIIQARWQSAEPTASLTISHNLSEGIKGWNQRTLKIPYELLREGGTLILETEADVQPVRRVALAWTWPAGVYMGRAAQTIEYITRPERTYTDRDLTDQPLGALPDTWSAGIWKANLQEQPEPLDEPLGFVVPLDTPPQAVIFRAKILGTGQPTAVWLNGRKLDPLAVEVPELSSPGYFLAPNGGMDYAGWRTAAIVIPSSYVQVGENSLVLEARSGAYIKDALLELNFGKEGAPLNPTPPVPVTPVGPAPLETPSLEPDLDLAPDPIDPIDPIEPLVIIGYE